MACHTDDWSSDGGRGAQEIGGPCFIDASEVRGIGENCCKVAECDSLNLKVLTGGGARGWRSRQASSYFAISGIGKCLGVVVVENVQSHCYGT